MASTASTEPSAWDTIRRYLARQESQESGAAPVAAEASPARVADAPDELIGYQEAAEVLGINLFSVRQLVERGHLHSIPHPQDRRRRLFSRREVEARARFVAEHPRGRQGKRASAAESTGYRLPAPPPALSELLSTTPGKVIVGAGASAILLLLVLAFIQESSPVAQASIIAGLAALALVIARELYEQGRIDETQRQRLEQLARKAETEPEPFISELERLLPDDPAA